MADVDGSVDKTDENKDVTCVAQQQQTDIKQQIKKKFVTYICSNDLLQQCDKMPKVPERASMIHSLIEAFGLLRCVRVVAPEYLTKEEICRFHSTEYIEFLKSINNQDDDEKYTEDAQIYGLSYDCPTQVGVYSYAALVAGASVKAAEAILDNVCDIAVNWFGGWHHAKRDEASGFCYVNDIVLAILKLREKYERILYVDLDLHHGDGVEDAFCATSKVLTMSFHKFSAGFFPGSGALHDVGVGKGKYYTVNVPLQDGIKDREYVALFSRIVAKAREVFQPEVVVCQCGADGLAGDPMDSFNMTHFGLAKCIHILMSWDLPLLLLGGGGYHFANTAKCWTYITKILVGKKLPDDIPDHKYLMSYGPDYALHVTAGNRKNLNTQEYLQKVYRQVIENLNQLGK